MCFFLFLFPTNNSSENQLQKHCYVVFQTLHSRILLLLWNWPTLMSQDLKKLYLWVKCGHECKLLSPSLVFSPQHFYTLALYKLPEPCRRKGHNHICHLWAVPVGHSLMQPGSTLLSQVSSAITVVQPVMPAPDLQIPNTRHLYSN